MISKSKTRAASYCRMSDIGQEHSIPAQRAAIQEYAAKNGYRIVGEYEDSGISGDDADRTGFNSLIQDAGAAADFEVVLCWDQDRFSRFDPITANYYWYQLRKAGVRLVTINQGEIDFNSISGILTATVNQYSSNEFLKKLSKNVCRGMRAAAQSGRWTNGRPPYGYRTAPDKSISVSEAEADIVRWLFDSILRRDVGICGLCRELNDRKLPSPTGRARWRVGTLKAMLSNAAYTGLKIYGLRPSGKHCRLLRGEIVPVDGVGSKKRGRQSLSDCLMRENSHAEIVSCATFSAVQEILKKRSKPNRTKRTSYALSGLVFCGHCGRPCHGQKCGGNLKADRPYYYYACGARKDTGVLACSPECRYLVNAGKLFDYIRRDIQDNQFSDKNIRHYENDARQFLRKSKGQHAGRESQLSRELEDLNGKLAKLESRLSAAPDDMLESLYSQIRTIRERRDRAHLDLAGEKRLGQLAQKTTAESLKGFVAALEEIHEALDSPDTERVRRALQQSIERIEVFSKPPSGPTARKNTKRSFSHVRIVYRTDIVSTERSGVSSLG